MGFTADPLRVQMPKSRLYGLKQQLRAAEVDVQLKVRQCFGAFQGIAVPWRTGTRRYDKRQLIHNHIISLLTHIRITVALAWN